MGNLRIANSKPTIGTTNINDATTNRSFEYSPAIAAIADWIQELLNQFTMIHRNSQHTK